MGLSRWIGCLLALAGCVAFAEERGSLVRPLPATDLPGGTMELAPKEFGELIHFLKTPFVLPTDIREKHPLPEDTVGATYAGVAACTECHAKRVATFKETAHAKTSALPSDRNCLGTFEPGKNRLQTSLPALQYVMQKQGEESWWQTALLSINEHVFGHQEAIGMVTGSGKVGQTYLFWRGERLYELPVSWWTDDGHWVTSPGFREGQANFARPITPRCLECHSTYILHDPEEANRFEPKSFHPGITCEKCHGPAAEHVAWHRTNPDAKEAMSIVQPAQLAATTQMQICNQCHSGIGESLKPPFSYRPGEPLDDYFRFVADERVQAGEIHTANQVDRLSQSECFKQSEAMTCVTCHNPHRLEHGDLPRFSARCLKCHEVKDCTPAEEVGGPAQSNCIHCHMPSRADERTHVSKGVSGETRVPLIRDHHITVYPVLSERVRRAMEGNADE